MHLFLDLPDPTDSASLTEIVTSVQAGKGLVHSLGIHPNLPGVATHRPGTDLGKLLETLRLSPDDCTLLGCTQASQEIARRARVRFARLRHGLAWESPVVLDADFASLEEALDWFRRHAVLETCGWPIATVGGLVFRPDGRAFFVRTAKWSGKWGTPGGKIDYGETHLAAFVREMREETGLAVESPRMALVQEAIEDPDFVKPRHFLLLNLVGKTSATQTSLNHESLDGRWMTLEESLSCDLNRPTLHLVRHLLDHPGDLP